MWKDDGLFLNTVTFWNFPVQDRNLDILHFLILQLGKIHTTRQYYIILCSMHACIVNIYHYPIFAIEVPEKIKSLDGHQKFPLRHIWFRCWSLWFFSWYGGQAATGMSCAFQKSRESLWPLFVPIAMVSWWRCPPLSYSARLFSVKMEKASWS